MKQRIDLAATLVVTFALNHSFKSRFTRYWGTTVVDGVDVFNKEFEYYPNTSSSGVQKLLNVLGIRNAINNSVSGDSMKGIARAWMYLDSAKVTDSQLEDLTANMVGRRIENSYDYDHWYECQLQMRNQTWLEQYIENSGGATTTIDTVAIEAYLRANTQALINNVGILCERATVKVPYVYNVELTLEENTAAEIVYNRDNEEYVQDVLGKYLWLDTSTTDPEYTFEIVVDRVTVVDTTEANPVLAGTTFTTRSINVTYRVRRKLISIDDDNPLVVAVTTMLSSSMHAVDAKVLRNVHYALVSKDAEVTNALWYRGYLRKSTMSLERDKFTKLVLGCMNQDYTKIKKKKKWWQALIAIVVMVVIIYFSGGAAAPAAGAAWGAVNVAYFAALVAIGLTLAQLAANKMGYGHVTEMYDGFIKVSSMVSMIAGVSAVVQNMAREAAKQAIMQSIKTYVTQNIWKIGFQAVCSVAKYVTANRLENIQNENNSLSEKIAAQEEELYNMYDSENNLPLEVIQWAYEPLASDQSMYAVDYKYEPTKMNICRRSFV